MAVILGLCAAVAYGAADFVGGLVTKRASAFAVVLISQGIGAVATVAMVPLFGGELSAAALGWGAVAGGGGGAGVLLLYRGLARGRMAVVAPVTAVLASTVPVVFGLVTGERPRPLPLAGIVIASLAVVLISRAPDEEHRTSARGLMDALGAGLGFGIFFIALDRVPDGSGIWSLVGARASALCLVGGIVVLAGISMTREARTLPAIALAGILDVVANAFYLAATREGLLSIVAVLTSLYPAITILLARIVLGERLGGVQAAGLVLGAGAVTLIALG